MFIETVENRQLRADREARNAYDFVVYNQAANAREIAESVDEPSVLIEKLILALNGKGSVADRYAEVVALVSAAARDYANDQAEAAANHVMSTPS